MKNTTEKNTHILQIDPQAPTPVGLSYRYIFFIDTSYHLHHQKNVLGHCRLFDMHRKHRG